jgi:hypothetical protein
VEVISAWNYPVNLALLSEAFRTDEVFTLPGAGGVP